jgi:hypothetical protein
MSEGFSDSKMNRNKELEFNRKDRLEVFRRRPFPWLMGSNSREDQLAILHYCAHVDQPASLFPGNC